MTGGPGTAGIPCPACGSTTYPDEVFCEVCGRRIHPVTPADRLVSAVSAGSAEDTMNRLELVLRGVAAVSDRGRRRSRNEDAVGLSGSPSNPGVSIAVVCDGVGSTTDAHLAARAAADAAVSHLEEALASGDPGGDEVALACGGAFTAARDAVASLPFDWGDPRALSPSTTLVAAVVVPGRAVVASMGDSRAYWLPASGAGRQVTVDDSLAQEQIAEGADPGTALAGPDAHTITRWIGADAETVDPRVVKLDLTTRGRLVVCTDGLWNYFEEPDALAGLAAGAPDPSPLTVARTMVSGALGRGGGDNITVAVIDGGPATTIADTGPPTESCTSDEEGPP